MLNKVLEHDKIVSSDEEGIRQAIEIVREGGVVILPADTVYGFFCIATKKDAVERVYEIKNREKRKPFVIYTNKEKVGQVVELNDSGRALINGLWPKALSLILPKTNVIEDWFTQNNPTLAVMTAQNPVVSKLIAAIDEPVLGTTVNISGEPEMKKAEEVIKFIDQVDLILADDSIPVYNMPSTMVDCTVTPPKVARLSSLKVEELCEVIPDIDVDLARRIG